MKRGILFWWLGVLVLLITLYAQDKNKLPHGVHSWAQSDRYALACMFYEDGRFFNAATYNLMSDGGRVGVEFPIVPFISAKIAHVLGRPYLPVIMRFLNLLILIGSLLFLSSLSKVDTIQFSGLLTIFLFSPLLIFYGYNFIPDTTGLSLTLIAFGFLWKFTQNQAKKYWIFALVFGALAAAIKTTSGIFFIAIAAGLFLFFVREKNTRNVIYLVLTVMVLGGLVFAYDYFFFHKINKSYWSIIFMSSSRPITSFADFQAVFKGFKYWSGQWITLPQAMLIVGMMAMQYRQKKILEHPLLRWVFWISLLGVLSFISLMGLQFIDHDYYFIASVLPLIFLAVIILYTSIQKPQNNLIKYVYQGLIALCLLTTGFVSFTQLSNRQNTNFTWKKRDILNDVTWMLNGDKILTHLGIKSNETIFVFYEFAPNTPLVYFNRKGRTFNHEEMSRAEDNLNYWLDRIKPDYIIVQSKWLPNLAADQPQLKPFLTNEKVHGEIVLYQTNLNK